MLTSASSKHGCDDAEMLVGQGFIKLSGITYGVSWRAEGRKLLREKAKLACGDGANEELNR
jgi:CRISPR/Cas system endoribonuclease Cas6 (RAMP superfamily)